MPPLSRRRAPRLLRQVDGKPHASNNDHEEELSTRADEANAKPKEEEERDINADPISSDDEPQHVATASTSQVSKKVQTTKPVKAQINSKPKRPTKIQAPRRGTYGNGQAGKAAKNMTETGKENSIQSPRSAGEKRMAEDGPPMFGMEHMAVKKPKGRTYNNIHATSSVAPRSTYGAKKTFGTKKTFGSKASTDNSISTGLNPSQELGMYAKKKQLPDVKDDSDDSDLSDVSMESIKLPSPKTKRKHPLTKSKKEDAKPDPASSSPKTARPNLGFLASYRQELTSSQASAPEKDSSQKPEPQDSDINTPASSLQSAAPGEAPLPRESLQNIEKYFADLPSAVSDDKCPLCEEPISQEHYWTFWKAKKMTIRQQTLFCREHKKREALIDYRAKGYPEIDWEGLAQRMERHRKRLIAVLRDEEKSTYREAHAERVATGEERSTVKKMMKDESIMDCPTGYYGSRGTRAMMETITTQLADVIRECVQKDRLVSVGGFATFVLRVLVPELTICLVMEDFEVGEEKAREIIDESGELGLVVNDEVEDEIKVQDDDDDIEREDDVG